MAQGDGLTWEESCLLVLALLLILILVFLILVIFFREQLAKCCPCLVVKVKPEEKTGWHHLDRFGEVKLKVASYSIPEIRARKYDSVEEGSVYTNVSLQVPVFEEKLNGMVTKKSVHVASTELSPDELLETPKKKKKKKKKAEEEPADPGYELETRVNGSPVHYRHYEETL